MHTRVITITSGKGGVGKTNLSAGLAMALAGEGHRVCLFDADLGLANINILLGLDPEYNLEDLIAGRKTLEDILIRGINGVDIIPGSSGVEGIANLDGDGVRRLVETLGPLKEYDFLIFDTSAGISAPVISFCMAATEVMIVVTPEPTSLTDAYVLMKVLVSNGFGGRALVVVNQCTDMDQAKKIFQKFNAAVTTHLKLKISLAGIVFKDGRVTEAVRRQKALVTLYPESKASRCIGHMARILVSQTREKGFMDDLSHFWEKCFDIIKHPLPVTGGTARGAKGSLHHKGDRSCDVRVKRDDPNPAGTAGEVLPALVRELIERVSTISEEIRKLRESMSGGQGGGMSKDPAQGGMTYPAGDNRFILDYDAFLEKHHEKDRGI